VFIVRNMFFGRKLLISLLLLWLTGLETMMTHAADGDFQKGNVLYEKNSVLWPGKGTRSRVRPSILPLPILRASGAKMTVAELLATIENGRPTTAMGKVGKDNCRAARSALSWSI
jgi:hypothetical protein